VACKPGAVEVLLMRLQRFIAEVRAGKRQLSDSPEPHGGVPFQAHMAMSGGGSGAAAQHFAAGAGFGPGASAQGTARSGSSGGGGGGGVGAGAAAMGGGGVSGIAGGSGTYGGPRSEEEVARANEDAAQAAEKDRKIAELEDMVDILTQKVTKLEQLVRLKDTRIGALSARIVSVWWGGAAARARPQHALSRALLTQQPPHTRKTAPPGLLGRARLEGWGASGAERGGSVGLGSPTLFFFVFSHTAANPQSIEQKKASAGACTRGCAGPRA
jgi:hypothetical protein